MSLKNIFVRSFEHNTNIDLPYNTQKAVYETIQSIRRESLLSSLSRTKEVEFAHARLHMRLYQQYDRYSTQTLHLAHRYLDELIAKKSDTRIHLVSSQSDSILPSTTISPWA